MVCTREVWGYSLTSALPAGLAGLQGGYFTFCPGLSERARAPSSELASRRLRGAALLTSTGAIPHPGRRLRVA